MAHTYQTANYNLPQFVGTDVPTWLADVNPAYETIDTAIHAAQTTAEAADSTATSAETLANNAKDVAESAQSIANSALSIAQGQTAQIANATKNAGSWIAGQTIAIGTTSLTVSNTNIHPNSIIDVYYAQDSVEAASGAGITYTVAEGSLVITLESSASAAINLTVHVVNP